MNTSESRVYSQLNGSGQFAWNYDEFKDIHLRERLAFPAGSTGKAGIFCGSLFCCLNYDSQAVELWNGSTKLGSYSQTIQQTPTAILRTDPTTYTIEMRIRGSTVRVYSGVQYAQVHGDGQRILRRNRRIPERQPYHLRTAPHGRRGRVLHPLLSGRRLARLLGKSGGKPLELARHCHLGRSDRKTSDYGRLCRNRSTPHNFIKHSVFQGCQK